jgi:hypothetical protein
VPVRWVTAPPPGLDASATMARATAAASDPVAAGTLTTRIISSAVCALRMLAFLADAAWLAMTANAAGRDGRLLP